MAESTPAPAHANWHSVLVNYGSLVAILGAVLMAQGTAYLTLYGQLTNQSGQLVGVAEHLRSIDQQLAQMGKRLDRLEETDRQLLTLITERDREFVAALNEIKLSTARIEQRLEAIEQRLGGKR